LIRLRALSFISHLLDSGASAPLLLALLSPRKCEQWALCERSDVRGLAHGQIDTAISPDPATMLPCVFF